MAGGNLVKTALQGANIGDGINVIMGISDYKNAREQGDNKAVSLAKAAGSFAWGEMLFGGASAAIESGAAKIFGAGTSAAMKAGLVGNLGFTAAYMAVTVAPQIAATAWQHTTKQMGNAYSGKGQFGSGYFDMTNAGYTMRQRSLNAIRQNGLNTQSVLGNEARTYFRGAL